MRKSYIEQQRSLHGRRAVAVLPIHYPKPLLTAMDLLAVELWGPPGAPMGPDAGRIQPYVCAVVRNALAFMGTGSADVVDAMLFPHTCDSIQGLASVAPDFGGWDKPVMRFLHPKGDPRASSRRFARRELESLAHKLADFCGQPLVPEKLEKAIALHQEIDALRLRLLTERTHLPLGDRALYDLLRRGEYLWPEDHLAELQAAAADLADEPVQTGVPLMITGLVPEPMDLLDTLADANAIVVADDYAAVGRRLPRVPVPANDDPFDTLVAQELGGPPCPTSSADQPARLDYLSRLYADSGAKGLLIHETKFCEPELFDVPAIKKRFTKDSVPVLYVETELEGALSGQTVTRLEAFVEMVTASMEAP